MDKKQFSMIEDLYNKMSSIESQLRVEIVKGIKGLLTSELKTKELSLASNDIFIANYYDGSDYSIVMLESVYLDSNGEIHVTTDNNSDMCQEDIKIDILYCLYNSIADYIKN